MTDESNDYFRLDPEMDRQFTKNTINAYKLGCLESIEVLNYINNGFINREFIDHQLITELEAITGESIV